MNGRKVSRRRSWIFGPIAVLLLLGLACGAAATPAPRVVEKTVPAPQAVEKTVPAPQPVTKAVVATPTPVPPPSAIERAISSGKVTMMVGALANERFDQTFSGSQGNIYGRLMHAMLVATNEKLDLLPGIATSWDLSKDGRTWTFTIRPGVKFHDGTPLTVEDALWSMQHYFNPEALTYSQGSLSDIRNTEKIQQAGPDKVSLTTKKPRLETIFQTWSEAGTAWRGIIPKRPTLHDDEVEAAYDKKPIASGFMKLVKHTPSFLMAFERFDDYYYQPKNGLPEDKRVNFRWLDLYLVREVATRVAAIRAGEADIAPASLAVRKQLEAGGGRVVFGPEGSYFWITMRGCFKPQFPCHDKRVRQALNYAIDKEVFRDKLYGPEVMQVKGWNVATPSAIGYSPELDPPPFDPNRARQLLADAGYPGGKGFGKLIVNVWVSQTTPFLVESAQLAGDFWKKELGLEVEIKVGDEQAIKKDEDAGRLDGQITWKDNEASIDRTNNVDDAYGVPKGERRVHEDPALYEVTQKAITAVAGPQERQKIINTLYRRLRDEHYQISLGYLNIPWAVGPRIANWKPYPMAPFPSGMHTITLK